MTELAAKAKEKKNILRLRRSTTRDIMANNKKTVGGIL